MLSKSLLVVLLYFCLPGLVLNFRNNVPLCYCGPLLRNLPDPPCNGRRNICLRLA